jgi:hypothetical protein
MTNLISANDSEYSDPFEGDRGLQEAFEDAEQFTELYKHSEHPDVILAITIINKLLGQ